jgi:hypothetical protein
VSVFDIVMKKPAEVSWRGVCLTTDFSRFFHDYIKHIHCLDWLQQVVPWLYQAHPSPWLTSAGFSMTISNTLTASTDFSRFFYDYVKHTHRLDWLQQVFPWLYQIHPSLRLTSAGFSMTISNTPIASTALSHECVWYSHGKTCWSQSRRWVC